MNEIELTGKELIEQIPGNLNGFMPIQPLRNVAQAQLKKVTEWLEANKITVRSLDNDITMEAVPDYKWQALLKGG